MTRACKHQARRIDEQKQQGECKTSKRRSPNVYIDVFASKYSGATCKIEREQDVHTTSGAACRYCIWNLNRLIYFRLPPSHPPIRVSTIRVSAGIVWCKVPREATPNAACSEIFWVLRIQSKRGWTSAGVDGVKVQFELGILCREMLVFIYRFAFFGWTILFLVIILIVHSYNILYIFYLKYN